jgi:hypothetical protein
MRSLTVTAVQASLIDWAIGGMDDYAESEDNEGYGPEDVPRVEGLTVIFPTSNVEMIDDLLYRLEDQLPDVADAADTAAERRGAIKGGKSAAGRIRTAFPEGAHMRDMRRKDPNWQP